MFEVIYNTHQNETSCRLRSFESFGAARQYITGNTPLGTFCEEMTRGNVTTIRLPGETYRISKVQGVGF